MRNEELYGQSGRQFLIPHSSLLIENLVAGYPGRVLLRNLSFCLPAPAFVAILGHNGSGKTTLLRVLTGEEAPDAGKVAWANGAKMVSYNQVLAELDDADTVTHAVNAMPDSLALTATKKSVNRFLTMFQFSEADLKQKIGVYQSAYAHIMAAPLTRAWPEPCRRPTTRSPAS